MGYGTDQTGVNTRRSSATSVPSFSVTKSKSPSAIGAETIGCPRSSACWLVLSMSGSVNTCAVVASATGRIAPVAGSIVKIAPAATGGVETVPVADELQRVACVSDEELQALRAIARRVERHYGRAQDIEWAVDRTSNEILLLQSRPETVWSARDAAPSARAAENPLSHVMSIFGGRKS